MQTKLSSSIIFILVTCGLQAQAAITPAPPAINATAYMVMDYHSGRILVEKDIDKRVEPASLTKMMTTYVISNEIEEGSIKLADLVLISEKAWKMEGSRMFVEVNKQVTVEDLLKGVIIQSGNDASVALAEHVAGTEEAFAAVMNQYAAELGMTNTHFTNSTGLPDPNHYTTARDLAILGSAMIRDHPEMYAWHAIKEFTFNNIKQPNRNLLLGRDGSVDGIKTGHTETAGYCLVVSAVRDGMRLVSVVMGTEGEEARARASASLLSYAFRFFETHKLYSAGDNVASSQVWKGESDVLNLGVSEELWVTVPRGQYKQLKPVVEMNPQIIAPVDKGSVQGSLKIMLENEEVAARPLVALEVVEEGGFIVRMKDEIRLLFQ
jgi:D-alanyl-D-alanine carboxypeptidase (penicillin-binding protein 5/6)